MSRHVVFGTGQVGRHLIGQLVTAGHHVVAVNRHGDALADAEVVAGDATDAAFTTAVCARADSVTFCLNASTYAGWAKEFPPLQQGVLAGAVSAGARLVVLDNLYAYGAPHGRSLVETMAAHPTSKKSAARAAMTDTLLRAHQQGQVDVAIGRASDFFGPGATNTALGENVFGRALTGAAAQVMGDPDQLHSYSYTPDVAAGLATLATEAGTTGRIWHLPVGETRTTRQLVANIYRLAGHRPRLLAAGRTTLAAVGLAKPAMREYLHTLYQFSQPWVVDDTAFCSTFGVRATSVDQALTTTVAWYRDRASPSHPLTDPEPERPCPHIQPNLRSCDAPPHRRTEDRPPGRNRARAGVHPCHCRVHRPRDGLRLPADPAAADG
jgi:nucleoside-diphosphate-sugar epimerase